MVLSVSLEYDTSLFLSDEVSTSLGNISCVCGVRSTALYPGHENILCVRRQKPVLALFEDHTSFYIFNEKGQKDYREEKKDNGNNKNKSKKSMLKL